MCAPAKSACATVITTTLDQNGAAAASTTSLAGGFHRYSVDEHWTVPHFEKMSYDNSELLKNYVHAYQVFGFEFYAHVARDIIRWMDEWLSDREHGGFYASQDADIDLDDDGDYFTWTVDEAKAVLDAPKSSRRHRLALRHRGNRRDAPQSRQERVVGARPAGGSCLAHGHRPSTKALDLLAAAKTKLYAARLKRPTPFVDKTVYVSWNAMCVSAYLQAAQVLGSGRRAQVCAALAGPHSGGGMGRGARAGARDRLRRSPRPSKRYVRGMLDDYAFTALACLDAYEVTGAISYFNFAQQIADADDRADSAMPQAAASSTPKRRSEEKLQLGALSARRKPFQDSPTPAGNPSAAIALLRLLRLHQRGEVSATRPKTRSEVFAGAAEQFGIYAGTYGIAATWLSRPHTQVVVVGEDEKAAALLKAATCSIRGQQVRRAPYRQRGGGAEPASGVGGDGSESAGPEGKEVVGDFVHEFRVPAAGGRTRKNCRRCCGRRSPVSKVPRQVADEGIGSGGCPPMTGAAIQRAAKRNGRREPASPLFINRLRPATRPRAPLEPSGLRACSRRELQHAADVRGGNDLRFDASDVPHLLVENLHGNLVLHNVVNSGAAAAGIGARHLDQLGADAFSNSRGALRTPARAPGDKDRSRSRAHSSLRFGSTQANFCQVLGDIADLGHKLLAPARRTWHRAPAVRHIPSSSSRSRQRCSRWRQTPG